MLVLTAMDPVVLIRQLLNSLSLISILLIAALGLGVIFGLMEVVNLAHGAMITLGAYVAYTMHLLGIGTAASFIVAPVVVGLVGVSLEKVIVKGRYKKHLPVLLALWGVSLIIRQLLKVIFGSGSFTVPIPGLLAGSVDLGIVTYSVYRLFLIGIGVGLFLFLVYLFNRTGFGTQSQAVIQQEEIAGALGVNKHRINNVTFGIGAAFAGLSGALLAPLAGVNPELGLSYLLEAFFVVIISGLGNIVGILVVSVLLGGVKSWVSFFFSISVGQIVEFVVAIVLILAIRRETWREYS